MAREPEKRVRTQREILDDGRIGPLDLEAFGIRHGRSRRTMKNYSSAGKLWPPDGYVSGNPWWWPSTSDKWEASLPGRGRWGARAAVSA